MHGIKGQTSITLISQGEYEDLNREAYLLQELQKLGVMSWHGYSEAYKKAQKRFVNDFKSK